MPAKMSAEYMQRWRAEHPEAVREHRRRYQARMMAERGEQYVHHMARVAVHNALVTGRLIQQDCEVCGDENTQAHHDDYSHPLDVRWLCQPHHLEIT